MVEQVNPYCTLTNSKDVSALLNGLNRNLELTSDERIFYDQAFIPVGLRPLPWLRYGLRVLVDDCFIQDFQYERALISLTDSSEHSLLGNDSSKRIGIIERLSYSLPLDNDLDYEFISATFFKGDLWLNGDPRIPIGGKTSTLLWEDSTEGRDKNEVKENNLWTLITQD